MVRSFILLTNCCHPAQCSCSLCVFKSQIQSFLAKSKPTICYSLWSQYNFIEARMLFSFLHFLQVFYSYLGSGHHSCSECHSGCSPRSRVCLVWKHTPVLLTTQLISLSLKHDRPCGIQLGHLDYVPQRQITLLPINQCIHYWRWQ